jgi:hypothetical protein
MKFMNSRGLNNLRIYRRLSTLKSSDLCDSSIIRNSTSRWYVCNFFSFTSASNFFLLRQRRPRATICVAWTTLFISVRARVTFITIKYTGNYAKQKYVSKRAVRPFRTDERRHNFRVFVASRPAGWSRTGALFRHYCRCSCVINRMLDSL